MKILRALLAAFPVLGLLGMTPALAQGYQVKAGDTLQIEVLEDPSLNRTVLVAPDGSINVPLAGRVAVAGNTIDAVQSSLASQLADNFAAAPNVYVSLQSLAPRVPSSGAAAAEKTIDIFVVGEAVKSGRLAVLPGTTVLQVFAEMGGFSKFAATKRIQLRRTDPRTRTETVTRLNYKDIEQGLSAMGSTRVQDGDVILVPQRKLFE